MNFFFVTANYQYEVTVDTAYTTLADLQVIYNKIYTQHWNIRRKIKNNSKSPCTIMWTLFPTPEHWMNPRLVETTTSCTRKQSTMVVILRKLRRAVRKSPCCVIHGRAWRHWVKVTISSTMIIHTGTPAVPFHYLS